MSYKIKTSFVLSLVVVLLSCALTTPLVVGQTSTDEAAAAKATADKAVADKAAADKAAADKAVADKAVADKAAADKVAADKAKALAEFKERPFVPEFGVYKYGLIIDPKKRSAEDPAQHAGMNDIIIVEVRKLKNLLNQAKCKTEAEEEIPDCTKRDIVLYLDGREIEGLAPESGAPIPEDGTLRFHIQRTEASDEAWADLLGAPPLLSTGEDGRSLFIQPVKVSVGLAGDTAIRSEVDKFSFVRVHEWLFWFALFGLVALLIIVVVLAHKTSLLRDGVQPIGENRKGEATDQLPYSLGRCQMAFWFFLVIVSFFFIFLITWQFNTVTEQALALMGISAATALGAVIVSASKDSENQSSGNLQDAAIRYQVLKVKKEELQGAINQFLALGRSLTLAEKTDLQEKSAQLQSVKKQIRDLSTVSQGFLDDLLTDLHGYSFHRLQIFVWTIVLGIIFLHGVYNRLAMPAFSATLLALLGISGATYIGFKIPEKQEPAAPPVDPVVPPPPPPPPGGDGAAVGNANAAANANANVGAANHAVDPDDV